MFAFARRFRKSPTRPTGTGSSSGKAPRPLRGRERQSGRVRVLKTDKTAIALTHGDGRFHKTYVPGDNHRLEIFVAPDGNWTGEAVTVFDANRKDFTPAWQSMNAPGPH